MFFHLSIFRNKEKQCIDMAEYSRVPTRTFSVPGFFFSSLYICTLKTHICTRYLTRCVIMRGINWAGTQSAVTDAPVRTNADSSSQSVLMSGCHKYDVWKVKDVKVLAVIIWVHWCVSCACVCGHLCSQFWQWCADIICSTRYRLKPLLP